MSEVLTGAVVTAIELPADVFDQIAAMFRAHGGIDCSVWTFMNEEPVRMKFQGCPVIRGKE